MRWKAYNGIGKEFASGYESMNHRIDEYASGDVHVNNAESYFTLLKRGVLWYIPSCLSGAFGALLQ